MAKKPRDWQNITKARSFTGVIVGTEKFGRKPSIDEQIKRLSDSLEKVKRRIVNAEKANNVLKTIDLKRMAHQKALMIKRLLDAKDAVAKREQEKARHGRQDEPFPYGKGDFRRKMFEQEMPKLPEKLEIGMIVHPGKNKSGKD